MALNPSVSIYGYVQTDLPLVDFIVQANQWDALHIDGVFMDRAGYDFGTPRTGLNERISHIRSRNYANKCFVNCWNVDHVVGIEDDPSFPNTTYNPNGYESLLGSNDLYLLESFVINTSAYSPDGYASMNDWKVRGQKAALARKSHGIRLASVSLFENNHVNGQKFADFSYYAAMAFGIDLQGTANLSYGADAQVKYWKRPTSSVEIVEPVGVSQDLSNPDTYMRYGKSVKLVMTYSNVVHTAQVVSYNV